MADLSMVFDLLARDRASSEVNKVGDSMEGAGRSADRMGGLVKGALLGIAAGVAGATVGLYKVGEVFDDMSDTIRVGTGATGAALDDLTESARNIGTEVPASFEDIGATVADVNQRLGLTGPVLEELSGQILNAGRLLGEEVDVDQLSAAFSAFGVTGDQTTDVMDDLYRVSQATGVGLNDLAGSVAKGAPQLQQFGFSLSESAALLGSLDKAGLNSDATITALNKGMVAFAKAGKEPRAALEETIGGIEKFIAAGDQAGALDLAASLFGTKGAGQFVAAVQSGTMSLDDLMAATGATTDTISAASADTADFAEKWQIFKNEALLKLEPIATRVFNALGDGMEWISSTGGPALASFASTVSDKVGPAFDAVASFVTNVLVPALRGLFGFLSDHETTVTVIAALIGTVLAGAFLVWGTRAMIAAAQNVAAWFSATWAAATGAGSQSLSALQVVASWGLMAARALLNGVRIAVVWTAQTLWATTVLVAGWAAAAVSTLASWALMAAQALVNGVRIAAVWITQTAMTVGPLMLSWGLAAATVIGGWVLMGVQSLLNAARMAAAWLIAMGPVGWIIAAVIGLVALIIANWENIKNFTVGAFHAIVDAVVGAFRWIVDGVSNGISKVIDFVTALPGKILGALGDFGSLLLDLGGDLLSGLWEGISGAVDWLLDKIGDFFGSLLPDWVKDILGISSPSKVFAAFGRDSMRGFASGIDDGAGLAIAAAEHAAAAVSAAGAGVDMGGGYGSSTLGYSAPAYDLGGGAGAAAGATHTTIVSGVVGPEEVAAIVRRDQQTTEFLAGV